MSPRKSSARQAKAKATGPSGESSTPTPAPAASNARRRWNITGPRVPDLAPASDPPKDDDFTESSDDSDADQDVKKEEGVNKEEEPEDDFSGLLNHRFSSVKGEPEPDSLAKHKKAAKRAEDELRVYVLCFQRDPPGSASNQYRTTAQLGAQHTIFLTKSSSLNMFRDLLEEKAQLELDDDADDWKITVMVNNHPDFKRWTVFNFKDKKIRTTFGDWMAALNANLSGSIRIVGIRKPVTSDKDNVKTSANAEMAKRLAALGD
ncbi:hypothetical protein A4X06_0g9785, partial [Tilletia controversa]